MSRQIQLRRGTSTEHATFTGAIGEVTMDTDLNTLRVHDGVTPGGVVLARQSTLDGADYVVAYQKPTAANGYTWYRKYKSGWVEQGGQAAAAKDDANQPILSTINLPVRMFDSDYCITIGTLWAWPTTTDIFNISCGNRTPQSFQIRGIYGNEGITSGWTVRCSWTVHGMAA